MVHGQNLVDARIDARVKTPGDRAKRAHVYHVFAEALDQTPAQRHGFLDARCQGDPELRGEVDALLAAATLGTETGALYGSAPPEESLIGECFGRFRLVERIGEGGMGVVYRAERTDAVAQSAAIKVVSSFLAGQAKRRFEREVQILARIEHPSIARLIDAGVERGRAWLAMEYVRGERIDTYCESRRLGPRDIVGLLVPLAGAVAAAHGMLVVHSDIKPANVLVTADGQIKLIDFGIATALREASGGQADTISIARLFSPNYAAREQVSGGAVTVATDVFGIGALAYRLLSGAALFRDAVTPVAYMLAVSRHDVEPPSKAKRALGASEPEIRLLRGDLDAILLKSLEREPAQRYASAAELQADLLRYLGGRPVRARPRSPAYLFSKFVRRNAVTVSLSALFGASVIAGTVAAWVQSRSTHLAEETAARRGEFLEGVLKSANPREGRRDITVAEVLDESARALDQKMSSEPLVEASLLGVIVDTNTELARYPEALAASARQLTLLRDHAAGSKDLKRALQARGDVLVRAGKYREAETVLSQAVSELRAERGMKSELVLALGNLAAVYTNTDREALAETTLTEAIAVDHESTGYPQHQLAVLLANKGNYSESARLAGAALALQRKALSPDDPLLLTTEGTYAMTLSNLHRFADADPLLRELVSASSRVRGPDHPDTLVAEVQLGENLIDLRRFAEASTTLRSAAMALDRALNPQHHYALGAWADYAAAACNNHEQQEGLSAAQRVLETRQKTLPAGDYHFASTRVIIGLCLTRMQRYAQAEPMLLQAVQQLEASRGAAFYHTQRGYATLSELYEALGRTDDAAAFKAKLQ